MRSAALLLVIALLLMAGCATGGNEGVSMPVNVPDYDVASTRSCPVGNQDAKCINLYTEATSAKDYEAITRKLWSKNEDENALVLTFYPPRKPGADLEGVGYAFSDRRAARALIASQYTPSGQKIADIKGQVNEAMANDGIYVISIKDEVDRMTRSACADWDAKDVSVLGTPPPEWNCPGY
jgi:hypothetical protein